MKAGTAKNDKLTRETTLHNILKLFRESIFNTSVFGLTALTDFFFSFKYKLISDAK